MGFVLSISSIIGGFIKQNSRWVSVAILIVTWIIMGCNTYNDDYVGSEYLYNNFTIAAAGSGQTVGYQSLITIAHALNLSFFQFRMILSAAGLALVYGFISRYTRNTALILALYIICPFFYDIVQFRFFLASSISIYGLRFLIERGKASILLFILCVCIGALIHTACLIYLLFLLTLFDEKKCMYFSLLIAAGILIGIYSGMLAPLAALFVDSVKFEFYFTQKARFGFLQYWVIFALFMLLLWAISARRRLDKRGFIVRSSDFESDSSFNARQEKFIDFFMRSRFVLLPYYALLPLSVQNFYRLIRSFLIVMYIFLSIAVLERPIIQNHKENLLEKALFFVWVAANAIVVEAGVWDLVIVTELTENLLW